MRQASLRPPPLLARRATAAVLAAITALTPSLAPAFEFVPLEERASAPAVDVADDDDGSVTLRFKASTDPQLAAAQRVLVEAFGLVSQYYVDGDAIHQPGWKAALGAALGASFRDGTPSATAAAADTMLATLGDQYTRLLRPGSEADAYVAGAEGAGVAVGLQLRAGDDAAAPLRVAAVVPASPAAAAGIAVGDALLTVDGRPTAGRPVDDVARALTRDVEVTVAPVGGGRPRTITLRAAEVQLHAVQYAALTPADGASPIAYIRVAAFNRLAPGDAAAAVDSLSALVLPPSTLILDLRDDSGGAVDAGIDMLTSALLPSNARGVLFGSLTARGAVERVSLDSASSLPPTTRVAVLVNGGTASTAELVAAALRGDGDPAHPHALLVGETTFGKGRTQRALPLSDGSLLLVSNLRYVAPDGAPVDGVGLTPWVACAPKRVEASFFVAGGGGDGDNGIAAGLLQDPCVRVAAAELGTPLAE